MATYSGTYTSDIRSGINGEVHIQFAKDMSAGQLLWVSTRSKAGQSIQIVDQTLVDFTVYDQRTDPSVPIYRFQGRLLDRTMDFTVSDFSDLQIMGRYYLSLPVDRGSFCVGKADVSHIKFVTQSGSDSKCSLM